MRYHVDRFILEEEKAQAEGVNKFVVLYKLMIALIFTVSQKFKGEKVEVSMQDSAIDHFADPPTRRVSPS